jgi:hypothetical protein
MKSEGLLTCKQSLLLHPVLSHSNPLRMITTLAKDIRCPRHCGCNLNDWFQLNTKSHTWFYRVSCVPVQHVSKTSLSKICITLFYFRFCLKLSNIFIALGYANFRASNILRTVL